MQAIFRWNYITAETNVPTLETVWSQQISLRFKEQRDADWWLFETSPTLIEDKEIFYELILRDNTLAPPLAILRSHRSLKICTEKSHNIRDDERANSCTPYQLALIFDHRGYLVELGVQITLSETTAATEDHRVPLD